MTNAGVAVVPIGSAGEGVARPISLDWQRISADLDIRGSATIEQLITQAECNTLSKLYLNDDIFRSVLA